MLSYKQVIFIYNTGRNVFQDATCKAKCVSNATAKCHVANILPVFQFSFTCILLMMTDSNTLYNLHVYQTALTSWQYNHINMLCKTHSPETKWHQSVIPLQRFSLHFYLIHWKQLHRNSSCTKAWARVGRFPKPTRYTKTLHMFNTQKMPYCIKPEGRELVEIRLCQQYVTLKP